MVVVCAGISTRMALAQTSSASAKTSNSKTKSQAASSKTAGSAKKPAKTATASTSASKSHTASHSASASHSKSTVALSSKGRHTTSSKKKKTARGQQKIDADRAQEIQEALIREHYLSGEAAGTWNQASEAAMRRYQADHGWQSKTVPDSRALISLGLGPSHDHLLNPESAMVTGPFPTHSATLTPVSHSASPGAQGSTPSSNAPVPTQSSKLNTSSPQ
jgi:hypothetical protein